MANKSSQEDKEKRVKEFGEEARENIKENDSKKSIKEIVIIDDDQNYIKSLKRQFMRKGYNVVAFESPEEFLRYNLEKTDLILCDVLMPGINGFEVLKRIRSDKTNRHIPFIFISGSKIEYEQVFEAFDTGVSDFISKTCSPGVMLGRVKKALNEGKLLVERKQAEEALKENEEKYRNLFELSSDAMFFFERETGQMLDLNEAGINMYGYSREEALQIKTTDFSEEPDKTRQVIAEAETFIPVRYHRKKDGTVFPTEISICYFTWRGKEVCLAAIRDITERIKAEESLRESEEKYRALFNNANEAIYVTQDEKIKFPNHKTEDLFGYSAEELTSKPFTCFIHEKDRDMVFERYKRRLRGGEPPNAYNFRIVNKAGETKWVEIKVVLFSWENRPATLCFLTDITDNKQAEETLREEHHLLRNVIDNLPDSIFIKDTDYRYIVSNEAFARFHGMTKEDLVGKTVHEVYSQKAALRFHADDKKIMRSGQPLLNKEQSAINKETGKLVWNLTSKVPFRNSSGNVAGLVGIAKNITERKQMEEELRSGKEKLEQTLKELKETQAYMIQSEKMASVGQLAAGVAHEINNPTGFVSSNINTLSGYQNDIKSLLMEYKNLVDDLKDSAITSHCPISISEQVERILALEANVDIDFLLSDMPVLINESLEGMERIKKIVLDLKDFAHPGEDKTQTADINKSIESTLSIVWNELKYIATVTKEYGELPLVECYPQQLNQVFMNILVNAAQAMKDQGEIRVSTHASNGFVEIKISDTGAGISDENLSKIFDPFFTTKEVGKGTGLGLNVAYNIVKKHKGDLKVESEPGKGTTFIIRIPVVEGGGK